MEINSLLHLKFIRNVGEDLFMGIVLPSFLFHYNLIENSPKMNVIEDIPFVLGELCFLSLFLTCWILMNAFHHIYSKYGDYSNLDEHGRGRVLPCCKMKHTSHQPSTHSHLNKRYTAQLYNKMMNYSISQFDLRSK